MVKIWTLNLVFCKREREKEGEEKTNVLGIREYEVFNGFLFGS